MSVVRFKENRLGLGRVTSASLLTFDVLEIDILSNIFGSVVIRLFLAEIDLAI